MHERPSCRRSSTPGQREPREGQSRAGHHAQSRLSPDRELRAGSRAGCSSARNGNRSLHELVEHVGADLGSRFARTPAPGTHQEAVPSSRLGWLQAQLVPERPLLRINLVDCWRKSWPTKAGEAFAGEQLLLTGPYFRDQRRRSTSPFFSATNPASRRPLRPALKCPPLCFSPTRVAAWPQVNVADACYASAVSNLRAAG
jgi:hypothetical protein